MLTPRRRIPRKYLLAGLIPLLLLYLGGKYVGRHPASIPSLVLHDMGIRIFEPTFMEREPGEELIDGFFSYQPMSETKKILAGRGLKWTESGTPERRRRAGSTPPNDGYSITIREYSHMGYSGELMISFFNDRLSDIWFFPKDRDGYLKALMAAKKTSFGKRDQFYTSRHIRVWYYTDGGGRRYVGWADTRLQEEEEAWIMRYS